METKILSDYLCEIKYEDFSKDVVSYAKLAILDYIGVAISAKDNEVEKIWREYFFDEEDVKSESTSFCGFKKGSHMKVAAYNAACGHLLDLDDVHNSSITHPGTITIPAAFSMAEKLEKSGKDLITAVVCGYEICARVGEAINPGAYWFWHTTGVCGAFSSSVACGKLLGLNKEEMLNAVGSSGTESSGLWEFMKDGAMSKSLHTANATLCGIRAAKLAKLGFTGAKTILEGDKGLILALNKDGDKNALIKDLDKDHLKIMTDSFKPYACCRHTHSGNYAVEELKKEYDINISEIEKIIDRTYEVAINTAGITNPKTSYACKFSIPYCLSAMLLYGNLLGEVFSDSVTNRKEVKELAKKVEMIVEPSINSTFINNPSCWPHEVEIHFKNGDVIKKRVDYPLGDFNNPFTFEIEIEKFRTITLGKITKEEQDLIIDKIMKLEEIENVKGIFD